MVSAVLLDALVHVNALLPCVIVWYTLSVLKNAWAAVILFESVALVGLPLLTLWLRGKDDPRTRDTTARVRALLATLTRPAEWRRRGLAATGTLLFLGFGCFVLYLAVQREFVRAGINADVRSGSMDEGLEWHTTGQQVALFLLACWFCTANPLLEELFWRGYCYAEIGRQLNGRPSGVDMSAELLASAPTPAPAAALALDDISLDADGGGGGGARAIAEAPAPSRLSDDDYGAVASSGGGGGRGVLLQSVEQSALSRWLVSLYFGSYHGVVLAVFLGPWIGLVVFLFLAATSRAWMWLGERHPFGFPFIVAFHAGADLGIVLIVSAMDLGWARAGAFVATLCCSLGGAGVGLALLWRAWRHERFPSIPLCADESE